MKKIMEIAEEEGIKIKFFDAGDEPGSRYEMSLIGGGFREWATACNDIISIRGSEVELLVRRSNFFPHAKKLEGRLEKEGYNPVLLCDYKEKE